MVNFLKQNLLKVIIGACLILLFSAIFFIKNNKKGPEQQKINFEQPQETDYEDESFSFEDMINSNNDTYFGEEANEEPTEPIVRNPFSEKKEPESIEEPKEEKKIVIYSPKKPAKKHKINKQIKPTPPKKTSLEERLIAKRSTTQTNDIPRGSSVVQATAAVNENQTIYENSVVTVRLLEDAEGDNYTIKKNTYLYGVAAFNQNGRLLVNFNNINDHGQTRSIDLKAYDFLDGYEGLIISDPDVVSVLKNQTNDQATNEISSQGTVGRIISGVIRKKKTTIKITLYDEHQIILKGTL